MSIAAKSVKKRAGVMDRAGSLWKDAKSPGSEGNL
jgi:hypothetical protein